LVNDRWGLDGRSTRSLQCGTVAGDGKTATLKNDGFCSIVSDLLEISAFFKAKFNPLPGVNSRNSDQSIFNAFQGISNQLLIVLRLGP